MNGPVDAWPPSLEYPSSISAAGHTRYNPPGQRALSYRVGTYTTFLRALLDRARVVTVPDGPNQGDTPLEHVNPDAPDDFLVGLFKAWASVGDVLSFYQERIANEGYLRTATERRSIGELARMVGDELAPGCAATAYLAFTIVSASDTPSRVRIPSGTTIRNAANPNRPVVTFETSEDFDARAAWNALPAHIRTVLQTESIQAGQTELQIAGRPAELAPGSVILIVGRREGTSHPPVARLVRTVTFDERRGFSRIGWEEPLPGFVVFSHIEEDDLPSYLPRIAEEKAPPAVPEVYLLRRRAAPFGHDAPIWAKLPEAEKAKYVSRAGGLLRSDDDGRSWQQWNDGLPAAEITALADDGRGNLLVGTESGIYRTTDGGATWRAARAGFGLEHVLSLTSSQPGRVYLTTSNGAVYRSVDGSASWQPVVTDARFFRRGLFGRVRRPLLPRPGVRVVVELPNTGSRRQQLLAGTDAGVYRSTDVGRTWVEANVGLPAERADGCADVVVSSLVVAGGLIFAGTDHGLFRSDDAGRRWTVSSGRLSDDALRSLAGMKDPRTGETVLVAATNGGAFRSVDLGTTWARLLDGSVSAVALDPTAAIWAAMPSGDLVEIDSSHFNLETNQIDFGRVDSESQAGDRVGLQQALPEPLFTVNSVAAAQTAWRSDFGQSGSTIRTITNYDYTRDQVDLRTAAFHVAGERLALWEERVAVVEPVFGRELRVAGSYPDLPIGGWLSIQGRPLPNDDESLGGETGQIVGVAVSDNRTYTTVTLSESLQRSYDPTTVSICANVVEARAGQVGAVGNFGAYQLVVLPSSPPFVQSATNPVPTTGGVDPESLDSAKERVRRLIRGSARVGTLQSAEDLVRVEESWA
jgi:photosystem II stability/assembly factor-like uncharacterized protein